ncbi:hypothetical protein EVAR_59689_1 [Eumeta japonica]|uniref:Uncharacterized protein n=1 Tax=Eumeta variegata TaxID=151549 RepID=A0A4C1Z3U1_EUMVA|nr:hypothetical protein EVAR_59689_1 [Eumeta japonica]
MIKRDNHIKTTAPSPSAAPRRCRTTRPAGRPQPPVLITPSAGPTTRRPRERASPVYAFILVLRVEIIRNVAGIESSTFYGLTPGAPFAHRRHSDVPIYVESFRDSLRRGDPSGLPVEESSADGISMSIVHVR